jgi:rRNA maturation endonuclease Nob1
MSSLIIIIVVLIVASSFWYILSPLTSKKKIVDPINQDHRIEILESKKSEILLTLKDLKADHFSGKISDQDYEKFYQESMNEGALVLKEIEKINSGQFTDQESSDQVKPRFCTECGKELIQDAKFCAYCGIKIKV